MNRNTVPVDGKKIRELRLEKGWTQEDLAGEAGCAKRTIERLEQNRPCSIHIISDVATALGMDTKDLLAKGQPEDGETEDVASFPKTVDLKPTFKGRVEPDHRFNPTRRHRQVWKSGYDMVRNSLKEWGLGYRFLDLPSNQQALKSFVQQAITDNEVSLAKDWFADPDYARLSTSVTRKLDEALADASAYFALRSRSLIALTRAALYIYAQECDDRR